MKKAILTIAITASITIMACKGNPEGAMGVNDKADTTALDQENEGVGIPGEVKKDTSDKNPGPGKNKDHIIDSEHKKKH